MKKSKQHKKQSLDIDKLWEEHDKIDQKKQDNSILLKKNYLPNYREKTTKKQHTNKDTEEVIREYYYDPARGFSGWKKLYDRMKDDGINVKQREVKEFVSKQETKQIHKKVPKSRASFIPTSMDHEYQIDLIYLEDSTLNKGNKYALTCINIFTKVLDVEVLNKRDAVTVKNAMKKILNKRGAPKMIYSDEGSEFISNEFKKLMKEYNIEHITTKTHAPYIETAHRYIKSVMAQYLTSTKSKTWINVIDKIVKNYNTTKHDTTELIPDKVDETNQHIAQLNIIKKSKPPTIYEPLNVGDKVRYKEIKRNVNDNKKLKDKQEFRKSYHPQWSSSIYTVTSITDKKYTLSNNNIYIRSELQKVGEVQSNPNKPELQGSLEGKLKKRKKELPKHLSAIEEKEINDLIPATKSKKEIKQKLKREGIDESNIIKDKYNIGDNIKVLVADQKGKMSWYAARIVEKRGKEHLVNWVNGDDPEWLNLDKEKIKPT